MYKNTRNRKETKTKKKLLTVLIVVVFLLITGLIAYSLTKPEDLATTVGDSEIKYSPATEEETQAAEDNKQKIVEEQAQQNQANTPEQTNDQKMSVTPVFGYIEIRDGQVKANGFISTMIEEGGTCTLILKNDGQTAQTSSTALGDAQSTVCGLMQISTNQLNSGDWTATISYSSDRYEGVSEERIINVE
jgi:hypothetical protein